jgi:tRNA A37 threonylcarbamoyladenosine dehydratase
VLGSDTVDQFAHTRVILFGVGGVGSWCAEALVRSGFTDLTLVDSDVVCATNLNRQAQATTHTLGEEKVNAMRTRLLQINPHARITALTTPFTPDTASQFHLEDYDHVIDAIDSITNKVHLISRCMTLGVPLISSMGAAARIDPSRIKVDLLANTQGCPLARIVRSRLKKADISRDVWCVYSDEPPSKPATTPATTSATTHTPIRPEPTPAVCDTDEISTPSPNWDAQKKQINGSLVHITAIFGFTLAGLLIQRIHEKSAPSPVSPQKDIY